MTKTGRYALKQPTNLTFVCIHLYRHTWYERNLYVGNFLFKWVRTNLFAHKYCYCFFTVKWFQLLVTLIIIIITMMVARISLTLSRHSSLSFIAPGRSSGQHPVSSHSCWMYVRAGRPAFARPCVGVHKSTSLMSSSLLLQQCPACLVRLTWIV